MGTSLLEIALSAKMLASSFTGSVRARGGEGLGPRCCHFRNRVHECSFFQFYSYYENVTMYTIFEDPKGFSVIDLSS